MTVFLEEIKCRLQAIYFVHGRKRLNDGEILKSMSLVVLWANSLSGCTEKNASTRKSFLFCYHGFTRVEETRCFLIARLTCLINCAASSPKSLLLFFIMFFSLIYFSLRITGWSAFLIHQANILMCRMITEVFVILKMCKWKKKGFDLKIVEYCIKVT